MQIVSVESEYYPRYGLQKAEAFKRSEMARIRAEVLSGMWGNRSTPPTKSWVPRRCAHEGCDKFTPEGHQSKYCLDHHNGKGCGPRSQRRVETYKKPPPREKVYKLWTPELVARLRGLLEEYKTNIQIAEAMGLTLVQVKWGIYAYGRDITAETRRKVGKRKRKKCQ